MTAISLAPTIVPKSDQLNADDLIAGPITITVTAVKLSGAADQPISVSYEGDGGKPYKPCKSMRRVLVKIWGDDGGAYAGRRMTLYRDEGVVFGGEKVGGIRISHMNHIDRDVVMALTVTRAQRKPYTVKPLRENPGERTEHVDLLPILAEGRKAAARGTEALKAWWKRLDRDQRKAAERTLNEELLAAAEKADAAPQGDDDADDGFPGDRPMPDAQDDDTFPGDRPLYDPRDDDFPGDRP